MYSMECSLEAVAAFDERPSGREEQNRNQYEENVQHFSPNLYDANERNYVSRLGQSAGQFLFLGTPEALSASYQHSRAGFQRVAEAVHKVARQNHLWLHRQRAVAGQFHQLFHHVSVHQGWANERHWVRHGVHGNQQNAGIQPSGQKRSPIQSCGGSLRPGVRDHQLQLPARIAHSQATGVDAKLTACLHFFTVRVDP
jgi:hypothetical protein